MFQIRKTGIGKATWIVVIASLGVFLASDLFAGQIGRHARQHSVHHGIHSRGHAGPGICPQKRTTSIAPTDFLNRKNPLEASEGNRSAGESLFQVDAQPTACKICHGASGNGFGMMAPGLNPPPRNFTCAETMQSVSEGQMFWVIQKGLLKKGMPAYSNLTDEQIWEIIHYIKSLNP